MTKVQAYIGVMAVAACSMAVADGAERKFTQNVSGLKPSQCVAAGYVYEQGELASLAKGITQVCSKIKGRSVWLTVDQKSLAELNY